MADKFEWNLSEDTASFKTKSLVASVKKRFPHEGLVDVEYDGLAVQADLLQLSPHPPAPATGETIIDEYARGRDLIVTYAQTPARSVRPRLYWRILEEFSGVELLIALQTSLLDSDPTMRALTRFVGKDAEVLAADTELQFSEVQVSSKPTKIDSVGLFLIRPLGAEYSYAEMVYPSDFQGAEIGDEDGPYVRYELAPEPLEKGVIRKARVRGVFMPRENDHAIAVAAYKDLAAAAPPLTT
jgi:hypothetical protein